MFRTPAKGRAAKEEAIKNIKETFRVNRRKLPAGDTDEAVANEEDIGQFQETFRQVPRVHDFVTPVVLQESRRKKTMESSEGANVLASPARLRQTRSMDNRSMRSNASRSSLAKIEALDRNRQARENMFFERQRLQEEADEMK